MQDNDRGPHRINQKGEDPPRNPREGNPYKKNSNLPKKGAKNLFSRKNSESQNKEPVARKTLC